MVYLSLKDRTAGISRIQMAHIAIGSATEPDWYLRDLTVAPTVAGGTSLRGEGSEPRRAWFGLTSGYHPAQAHHAHQLLPRYASVNKFERATQVWIYQARQPVRNFSVHVCH